MPASQPDPCAPVPPLRYEVLIVGAGHGGAQAAAALRHAGFEGSIGLLGDEPDLPYERPPLSKDYLAGDKPFERLLVRPAGFWAERRIDLLSRRRVEAVDAHAHRVTCIDGATIGYGHLVWATGGAPRRLVCAGHDLAGVHTLRARADADRLRAEMASARRAVVIGGGYIGLEAAAVLVKAGLHVTVLEALPRVLARVAGEPLSRFYEAEHRARGVDLRLGVTVECLLGGDRNGERRVSGVRLAGGDTLACDIAVVGIGIVPAVQPLLAAGASAATGPGGVEVDAQCRTSLPDVFAIGDCAAHLNRHAGGARVRLESVQNAHDQASVVAKVLTGSSAAYDTVPWFWSQQYDLRLQTVGLSLGHDQVVVRGDPSLRSFSVVYLRGGSVIALDCVNATRDYVQGKRLVAEGLGVAPAVLVNTQIQLKDM